MTLDIKHEYNKLLSFSTMLYTLYDELVRLELRDDCDFFSNSSRVISDIAHYKSLEACSYDFVLNDNNDLMSLLLYINDNAKVKSKMFNVDDIITLHSSDIVKRVLYNVQGVLLGRRGLKTSKENFSYNGHMLFVNYKMLSVLDNDLLLAFLNVNQEKLIKEQNVYIKEKLIKAKYNTFFLNSTLDNQLLRNSYNIDLNNIFVVNKLFLSNFDVDYYKITEFQNSYFTNIVNSQIDKIMFYNENEINSNVSIRAEVEIRNSILIAALILLKTDVKNKVVQDWLVRKSKFYESISSKNVFDEYILTGFQRYDNFESKIKMLSL